MHNVSSKNEMLPKCFALIALKLHLLERVFDKTLREKEG